MEGQHKEGARYLVLDAETDSDLETIARAALNCSQTPLLVGSGGLAAQVAAQLARHSALSSRKEISESAGKAVLFIGSTHPVTAAQVAQLTNEEKGVLLTLDATAEARLQRALYDGCLPIFLIRWAGNVEEGAIDSLAQILRETQAHLLISGGDTAAYLCRIWGAEAIALEGELQPGMPKSTLLGGLLDGRTVCTKSGGFGAENTLKHAVEILKTS
jgi:uncharacterized protein YgbK (DUF1537 family)